MHRTEYFKLNGFDVGFSEKTDVRVRRGKVRVWLKTPPMALTRDLHNGMADHGWRVIPDFYMVDGLTIAAHEDQALPEGRYGHVRRWPYHDERDYRQALNVYGAQDRPEFFGTLRIEAGWLELDGVIAFGTDAPEHDEVMPVAVRKCFAPLALIPPRHSLSLEDALKLPADQVFDLQISNGEYRRFPEEILAFKRLERLGFGLAMSGPQCAFRHLPPGLFDLEHLHTLYLHSFADDLGALSPEIAKLRRLEELGLTSLGLTSIPDALTTLDHLDTLGLNYNRLTKLPDAIGEMPALRELSIQGNRFVSLPASLSKVPKLKIDHGKRALFADVRYRSRNPAPVDETLFDLSRHQELETRLARELDAISDDAELKRMTLACSTFALYAEPHAAEQLLPLGASKTGGCPHLPVGMAHPADRNGLLSVFHAQIDLSAIAGLQPWLPRRGMLYCFVNDTEYAEMPIVIYVDCEPQSLAAYEYDASTRWSDSDLDAESLPGEYALHFSGGISVPNFYNIGHHAAARHPEWRHLLDDDAMDDAMSRRLDRFSDLMVDFPDRLAKCGLMPPSHRAHSINAHVFTQHESPQEQGAAKFGGAAHEWMNLLCLESIDDFNFWDAGTLTWSIHKQDLAIAQFGQVVASIESS
jgi:Leucine-rich repeat (LRR) protein